MSWNQMATITLVSGGAVWWTLTRWMQVRCVCSVTTVWSIPEYFRGKLITTVRYTPLLCTCINCTGVVELETADGVIPLRPTSQQDRVWHLVKHFPDNGSADAHENSSYQPKVIPEIFLPRLVTTKVHHLIYTAVLIDWFVVWTQLNKIFSITWLHCTFCCLLRMMILTIVMMMMMMMRVDTRASRERLRCSSTTCSSVLWLLTRHFPLPSNISSTSSTLLLSNVEWQTWMLFTPGKPTGMLSSASVSRRHHLPVPRPLLVGLSVHCNIVEIQLLNCAILLNAV